MLTFNFDPFPVLESERMIFDRLTENDITEIIALRSNPEVMKYIPRPFVKTTEDALEHIAMVDSKITNNEGINWTIRIKQSPKMIGMIGHYRLKPEHYRSEVGYMLLPEYQGKGLISEALKKVIEFGFNNMKLHSIEAVIDPENIASEKVLQKCGFLKEAHFKENEFYEGKFYDSVIYSLLNK